MILILAVASGLLAAWLRSWTGHRRLEVPELQHLKLAFVAFLPQGLIFFLPLSKPILDRWAGVVLVSSQIGLLLFALSNYKLPGFRLLSLGMILNLTVILLNSGLMPISPETVTWLAPHAPPDSWAINQRLWTGKDIVLAVETTRLAWLSDYFRLQILKWRIAYSLGDLGIALGAFWFFWASAGIPKTVAC